jgi:hypothetical protein
MKPSAKELNCILFAKQFYTREKTSLFQRFFTLKTKKKDYVVSVDKSFTCLWADYGLQDYGASHMYKGPYTEEQKSSCIAFWVKELYSVELNLPNLLSEIQLELNEYRKQFMHDNPGGHISMIDAINALPRRIDSIYSNYM